MKTLEGRALREGEFSFVLTDVTDPNNPVVVETVKNQANGSFVFTAMEYRLPGIYNYTIHELDDNLGGVTYDKKVYNVLVVVTDDGIGNLSNTVSATYIVQELYSITAYPVTLDKIVFNNKYESLAASVQFFGNKNLIGRDLHAGEFTFALKDLSGNLIETVTNDANGEFRFSSIVYTKPGYYYYEVSEVNNGLGGITYDTSAIKVEVVVVDDGYGKLTAVFSTTQALEFTNFYHTEPATVQLSAKKELYGRDLREGEFSFKLLEASGHEIGIVKNNADGSITFPELKYLTEGTYTYYISELKGDLKGVTCDETVHTVVIKVTDNGRGKLVATVEGGEDIVFVNRYSAAPVTVALGGDKILEGRDLTAGEFTFVLKNTLGNVVETTTNDANGRFEFMDTTYVLPGTYIYTICEVAGDEVGMAYDAREYTILVKITDDGEGQLVATLSNSAYNVEFVNVYTAPEETTEIPEETTSPEETTQTPEETTSPEETTQTPEDTTSPEETTEAPEVTTAPEETTSPEETTGVTGDTTTAPEETTEIPEITTEEPVVTTTPEDTTSHEDTEQPWSPDTRDNANIIIWFGAIFVAFCTTAGVLFSKKHKDNENE